MVAIKFIGFGWKYSDDVGYFQSRFTYSLFWFIHFHTFFTLDRYPYIFCIGVRVNIKTLFTLVLKKLSINKKRTVFSKERLKDYVYFYFLLFFIQNFLWTIFEVFFDSFFRWFCIFLGLLEFYKIYLFIFWGF